MTAPHGSSSAVTAEIAQCHREIAVAEAELRRTGDFGAFIWLRDWQRELRILMQEEEV